MTETELDTLRMLIYIRFECLCVGTIYSCVAANFDKCELTYAKSGPAYRIQPLTIIYFKMTDLYGFAFHSFVIRLEWNI